VLAGIPDGTLLYVWNGGASSYQGYYSYLQGGPNQWYDAATVTTLETPPNLLPGTGYFLVAPPGGFTNTYVGTVQVTNNGSGTICTNKYNFVQNYAFVNPQLPIGGGLVSSLQMGNIPDGTIVSVWNGATSAYTSYYSYVQGGPNQWYDAATVSILEPEPTVAVGQCFFVLSPSAWTWTMTYTNQ
jgi:hypothetical protein